MQVSVGFTDLLAAAIQVALGTLFLWSIAPSIRRSLGAALAFPLGAGALAWLMFLGSWLGLSLTPVTVLALSLLAAAALILVKQGTRSRDRESHNRPATAGAGFNPGHLAVGGFALAVLAITTYLSLGRGYSAWDAMVIWGVKGIGFADQQTIMSPLGAYGLSYPINLPLQIALFRILNPASLIGSKVIFPLYYVSLILGAYALLERRGHWGLALAGSALVATVPVLVEHATIGYANLPFTVYVFLGLICLLEASQSASRGLGILAGTLLGLASWTRPEGAFLVLPVLLLVFASYRSREGTHAPGTISTIGPALVFILVWQSFMTLTGQQGFFGNVLERVWLGLEGGNLNNAAFYWTGRYAARQLVEPTVWGLLAPLGALLLLVGWGRSGLRWDDSIQYLIAPALTMAVGLVAYYYLASYRQDIHYLLGTSVNRLFMPVWVIGFVGMLHRAVARQESDRRVPRAGQYQAKIGGSKRLRC